MLAHRVKRAARSELPALAEEAGYRLYRGFMYFCAHHHERTASARLYEYGIYSHCCQEFRDAIGLTQMKIAGTPGQAIRYLAERYNVRQESPPKRGTHAVRVTETDLISA